MIKKLLFAACLFFGTITPARAMIYWAPSITQNSFGQMGLTGNFYLRSSTSGNGGEAYLILGSTTGIVGSFGITMTTANFVSLYSGTGLFSNYLQSLGWTVSKGSTTIENNLKVYGTVSSTSGFVGLINGVDASTTASTVNELITGGTANQFWAGAGTKWQTPLVSGSTGNYAVLTATVQATGTWGINFSTIPLGMSLWEATAVSFDGKYITLGGANPNSSLFVSNDYGVTFTTRQYGSPTGSSYRGMGMSYTGQYQFVARETQKYLSSDYGVTFATRTDIIGANNFLANPSLSADGKYMLIARMNDRVWISTDFGVSFQTTTLTIGNNWYGTAISSSGKYMGVMQGGGGNIYYSSDYGFNWTPTATSFGVSRGMAMSGDGKYWLIKVSGDNIYRSSDYGVTYAGISPAIANAAAFDVQAGAISDTGKYMVWSYAGAQSGSEDYGVTWRKLGIGFAPVSINMSKDGSMIVANELGTNFHKSQQTVYDSGGYLGLHTSTPSSLLDMVNGSITIRGVVPGISIRDNTNASMFTVTNGGNVGIGIENPTYKLQVNGEPAANGYTAFTNYSDKRLKKNEVPLSTTTLKKLSLLDPVEFEYTDEYYQKTGYNKDKEGKKYKGFNAQNVKDIFPEMVSMRPLKQVYTSTWTASSYEVEIDTDLGAGPTKIWITVPIPKQQDPEAENYYSINTTNLQVYLTKALQELMSLVCRQFPTEPECQ